MQDEKLLSRQKINNGLELKIYDLSRKVAGDRYLAQLKCEVDIPVLSSYFDSFNIDGPTLLAELKKQIGEAVSYSVVKERNFVSEEEKDNVLAEMTEQVAGTMLVYFENPRFPEKVVKQKIDNVKDEILLRNKIECLTDEKEEVEDDGPADFSACFKD